MADTYDLDPAVRIEEVLNGDDIVPANRLEYFLKKAASGGGGGSSILVATLIRTGDALRLDKTWRECKNADLVIVHPETNTGKFYYVIGIEQVSSNYNVTIAMPDFLGETNISWSGYTLTTDTETGYPEFTDV